MKTIITMQSTSWQSGSCFRGCFSCSVRGAPNRSPTVCSCLLAPSFRHHFRIHFGNLFWFWRKLCARVVAPQLVGLRIIMAGVHGTACRSPRRPRLLWGQPCIEVLQLALVNAQPLWQQASLCGRIVLAKPFCCNKAHLTYSLLCWASSVMLPPCVHRP